MTPKQQREEISKAYVHAVAARCGYKVGTWSQDAGCIDVSIAASGILGAGIHSDPQLDLQLKATDDPRHVLRDGRVTFTLPRAHYDRLVAPRSIPKVLVVLVLPEDASLWVSHTAEQLVLRRCAWWRRMASRTTTSRGCRAQGAPSCDRRRAEARGYLRERPIFMGLLRWEAHEGGPFPTVAAGFSLTATSKRWRVSVTKLCAGPAG
jgi:hypothetical protein